MDDLYDYRLVRVREDGTIIGPAENVGWPGVEGKRMKDRDDLQLAERVVALRSDVEHLKQMVLEQHDEIVKLRERPLITAGASARINYGYCQHEQAADAHIMTGSGILTFTVDEVKRAAYDINLKHFADGELDNVIDQARKNRAYDNLMK